MLASLRIGARRLGSARALTPFTDNLDVRWQSTEPMPVRENVFKAAITARGRRQIGLWTGLRSNLVAEMLSHVSGFDWFVIDME
eukprot:g6236.t1